MPGLAQPGCGRDTRTMSPHEIPAAIAADASLRVPALLLAAEVLVLGLAERRATARLMRAGWVGRLLILPGTVLHEMAHAIAVVLCGGRIRRFVPFWPQAQPDGSTLFGYVQYEGAGDPLRRSLIAIAPLLLVPAALTGLTLLLLGTLEPSEVPAAFLAAGPPLAAGWALLVTVGTRGAFPSAGDRVGLLGAAWLLLAAAVLVAVLVLTGGTDRLGAALELLVGVLAVPAAFATILLLLFRR
jgi:hypothetical protein